MVSLGDCCYFQVGGDVPKERFRKEPTEQYSVPVYSNGVGAQALYGFTDIAKVSQECVTIAARGTIGYAALRKKPFYPVIRLICAIPKEGLLPGFLYYVIQQMRFQVPKTGIPQLTIPMISKYKIPIPPLDEQRRIVAILDRFDALCNDLTAGLPAELAARRKQYEYYRDRLLSFQALDA
ncbi:MAG: restriction endonuclease subunit S [Oscillibacter sp.]|nr:restriction endonuclease subunit S [Oscillibacter sp.]